MLLSEGAKELQMLKHKKTFCLVSVLCLIVGTALFVSCGQSVGVDAAAERAALEADPNYPIGVWESGYGEDFTINEKIVEYSFGASQVVYSGTFQGWVPDTDDEDSGIVFLQYTYAPYGVKGNFYAVRWERLTTTTVWLSGCADADGKPTLKEAMAEYTEKNKDQYFASGSDCKRIQESQKGRIKTTEKPPYVKYLEEKTGIIIFE
jgi:hypothetical protein